MQKQLLKRKIVNSLRKYRSGEYLYNLIQNIKEQNIEIDYEFPLLINIESTSICNLKCIHCPPQNKSSERRIPKSHMSLSLFKKIMDEIDQHGTRRISLHKDGEPLLNPDFKEFLKRVKQKNNHFVYLTTNAHFLDQKISEEIIKSKIDIINFSLGAASKEYYNKIRGNNFDKVLENIHSFLELRAKFNSSIRVRCQIINLLDLDMKKEINKFIKMWTDRDVEVEVWEELNWGIDDKEKVKFRYPCLSLWESITINSNGTASLCCIDWKHSMVYGDLNKNTISEIWKSKKLDAYRNMHIDNDFQKLDLCKKCNYWHWQRRLSQYKTKNG